MSLIHIEALLTTIENAKRKQAMPITSARANSHFVYMLRICEQAVYCCYVKATAPSLSFLSLTKLRLCLRTKTLFFFNLKILKNRVWFNVVCGSLLKLVEAAHHRVGRCDSSYSYCSVFMIVGLSVCNNAWLRIPAALL